MPAITDLIVPAGTYPLLCQQREGSNKMALCRTDNVAAMRLWNGCGVYHFYHTFAAMRLGIKNSGRPKISIT
jgi:hypothetical protein